MPRPRILPTGDVLLKLRREGKTYDEIAEMYGVTRGAVYLQLRNIPGLVEDRPSHRDMIPWRVKVEHAHAYPAMMLRLLGRRLKGQELPEDKAKLLDSWCKSLKDKNLVVHYDPDIPPNAASPKVGGWAYVERQGTDHEWIRPPAEPAVPTQQV